MKCAASSYELPPRQHDPLPRRDKHPCGVLVQIHYRDSGWAAASGDDHGLRASAASSAGRRSPRHLPKGALASYELRYGSRWRRATSVKSAPDTVIGSAVSASCHVRLILQEAEAGLGREAPR
jgi:hypothetical protein